MNKGRNCVTDLFSVKRFYPSTYAFVFRLTVITTNKNDLNRKAEERFQKFNDWTMECDESKSRADFDRITVELLQKQAHYLATVNSQLASTLASQVHIIAKVKFA